MNAIRYGTIPLEEVLAYDGFEFLEAMLTGKVPHPPMCETMGCSLVRAERGRAVFAGVPELRHYNPVGSVHGGFTAAILDFALTSAVHSTLKPGETCLPVEIKVNLVRPLLDSTGPVEAEGAVLYRGRTVASAEGKLIDTRGRLYAHATVTCTIFPAKEREG
jgi:uncharacterized protein (TIGR00369 family)